MKDLALLLIIVGSAVGFIVIVIILCCILCRCCRKKKTAYEKFPLLGYNFDEGAGKEETTKQSLLATQMLLRSSTSLEYVSALNIGSRYDKHYFDILHTQSNTRCMGQLLEKGPSCTLTIEDEGIRKAVQNVLLNMNHPNVVVPKQVLYSSSRNTQPGIFILCQLFNTYGSLRDYASGASYLKMYEKKWKKKPSMKEKQIAEILFQVLQGVVFIRRHGMQYSHLTTTNVMINNTDKRPMISDVWNGLMGCPPRDPMLSAIYRQTHVISVSSTAAPKPFLVPTNTTSTPSPYSTSLTYSVPSPVSSASSSSSSSYSSFSIATSSSSSAFMSANSGGSYSNLYNRGAGPIFYVSTDPSVELDIDTAAFGLMAYELYTGVMLKDFREVPVIVRKSPLLTDFVNTCLTVANQPPAELVNTELFRTHIPPKSLSVDMNIHTPLKNAIVHLKNEYNRVNQQIKK